MRAFLCLLCCFTLLAGCATEKPRNEAREKIVSMWVEVGENNAQIVRVVTSEENCPIARTDLGPLTLQKRVGPPQWPVLVCEATAPQGAHRAIVENRELALLKRHPKKILVIGDTGCRVREGLTHPQECNDPALWPFAAVSNKAAEWLPDLVIHVGDYHYREGDCPKDNAGCKGATPGDNWASWNEDFVAPANKLLATAPWIMVRGNHELCNRGGQGWFALLEPRAYQVCNDSMPPIKITLNDRELWDIDTASDKNILPSLAQIPHDKKYSRWILTHRPFVTPGVLSLSSPKIEVPKADLTSFSLVLAGHVHVLSLNTFKGPATPELIVGNAGTQLDTFELPYAKDPNVSALIDHGFGYVTMEERPKHHWEVLVHNVQGETIKTCDLAEKAGQKTSLRCK